MDSSGGDYHDRKWISQNESIQSKHFRNGPIIKGQYYTQYLDGLPGGESLEECLKRRSDQ